MNAWMTQIASDFLLIYGGILSVYLIVGVCLSWICKRHPEKKIQLKKCSKERVREDIKQSCITLLSISAFLVIALHLQRAGWGWSPPELTLWPTIGSLVLSMILFDTWFYWGHRLLHHKFLYQRVHLWHHKSAAPTAWNNDSDTFLDNFILQSYWIFSVLIFPIHPFVLLFHKLFDQVSGMLGHMGHEFLAGATSRYPSPMINTLYHDQHHQHVTYNYSTHFSVWDRIMGTIHPEYDQLVQNWSYGLGRPDIQGKTVGERK